MSESTGRKKEISTNFDNFIIYIKLKKVAPVKQHTALPRGCPVATAAFGRTSPGRWKCGELSGAAKAQPPCLPSWFSLCSPPL